ncbi:hypothetical protein [Parashewanella tropica]|uniref:hypothetical protein n=1 Tax=Parashewanella tropica TaxID=2547970 RepID=UPI0010598A5A|nr:hypothetical protein [Parashewanella tropica]
MMINVESKRRWQVYILILLITTGARTIERFMIDVGGIMSNTLPILFVLWVAYGIYTCNQHRAVFNKYLWRFTSWVVLIATVLGIVFGGYLLFNKGLVERNGLILITYSILLLPAFYKTWQYGYRSDSIWR